MGRRSINTTKSGKYMNPTDQARKEARKKELKKNKKQRQMVRAAVLKGKDPQQLIVDLEKIDQMEYNVLQPSPLNEKVLKDKRKKLKDTLDRVLKMYNKDDPDKWAELKRLQVDYERKRTTLFNYYESVKNAQAVQVDDIPLPINALPAELQAVYVGMPSQIPLPAALAPPLISSILRPQFPAPPSILKKTTAYPGRPIKKEPPGVPPGPPPSLDDLKEETPMEVTPEELPETIELPPKKSIRFADEQMETELPGQQPPVPGIVAQPEPPGAEGDVDEEEDDGDNGDFDLRNEELTESGDVVPAKADGPRPTSLQQRMLQMAGQDIDQFMKEMEQVHKKRRETRAANLEARLQAIDGKEEEKPGPVPLMDIVPEGIPERPHPMGMLPGLPPMMFRPPPPRGVPSLLGIRLPPGPPPGLPPRMGIRLPPGPPPGLPPGMLRPPSAMPTINLPAAPPAPAAPQSNVLSAAPQLISRPSEPTGTTIQAQAKIRNLSAEVTRFLPTALRVKRDDKTKPKLKAPSIPDARVEIIQPPTKPQQTKDDAYKQFMREMEGLL